ncbi:MAG: diguanylate cyclase [Thermodesulfobacteriota bacterium]
MIFALKRQAQGIESSLQRPGDFCARYGGEEFAVILTNTPSARRRACS